VTREQMAIFLHRGLPRVAFNTSAVTALNNIFQDTAVVTINTGGTAGGTGFVKLDASLLAYNQNTTGCPCEVRLLIIQDDGGAESDLGIVTIYNANEALDSTTSSSLTWVFSVPTASTQTFRLLVGRLGDSAAVFGRGQLTALYVPFGATGGNTLNPPAMAPLAVSEAREVQARTHKSHNEQ
jgi:hypothetical protein